MSSVEERLARNEVLFRAINQRIRELAHRFDAGGDPVTFICECADETCVEKVALTLREPGAGVAAAICNGAPGDEEAGR